MCAPKNSTAARDDVAAVAAALGRLTAWASDVEWDDIPEPVRRRAALVLIDDMSAIIAGRDEPEVRQLQDRLMRFAGPAEATVFNGRDARADRHTAAVANAAAGTWCELDEGFDEGCGDLVLHVGAVLGEGHGEQ